MKRFKVSIPVGATAFISVEAINKEEAIKKALSEGYPPSVCHQCSNEVEICEFYDEESAEAYEE